MANVDGIVQEAVAALKAGRKDEAAQLLNKAVDLDERNEQAWLWLSACVETREEQQICLENVLAINPANQKARKGLEALTRQFGQKPAAASPSPAPSTAPASDPFGSGFANDPFAGSPFDTSSSGGEESGFGMNWGSADVPAAPASSVEWGGDKSPTSGSGKNVPQPSSDEYDHWVSGLQLGSAPVEDADFNPSSGPFAATGASFDDADPFAGSSFGSGPFNQGIEEDESAKSGPSAFADFGSSSVPAFRDEPFAAPGGSADDSDLFGGSAFGAPTKSEPFGAAGSDADSVDDLFASPPPKKPASRASDPAADLFSNVPGTPKNTRPAAFANDPLADLFLDEPAKPAARSKGRDTFGSTRSSVFGGPAAEPLEDVAPMDVFGSRASAMSPYFKSIPPDIKVGNESLRLMLGVGLLAVLNAVSLAFLLLNLMKR